MNDVLTPDSSFKVTDVMHICRAAVGRAEARPTSLRNIRK